MTIAYIVLVWSVVQFLLLVLRLTNRIHLDWEWVYLPIWLPITIVFFLSVLGVFLYLAGCLFIQLIYLLM